MSNNTEVVSKDDGTVKPVKKDISTIPSSPYTNVKRELSEEELKSPVVQKLLLSEHDRMAEEIAALKGYVDDYHKKDKENAILSEKLKYSNSTEILYSFCLTGGSALAGISSLYWDKYGYILLLIGFGFIIGGVISKFVKK